MKEILEARKALNLGPATIYEIFDQLNKAGNYQYEGKEEDARRGVAISIAKNTAMFIGSRTKRSVCRHGITSRRLMKKRSPPGAIRRRASPGRHNRVAKSESTPAKSPEPTNGSGDKTIGHANTQFEDSIFKIIEDKFAGNFKTTELFETVGKEKPELAGHRSEISFALAGLLHRKKVRRIQKGAGKQPGIYCKA